MAIPRSDRAGTRRRSGSSSLQAEEAEAQATAAPAAVAGQVVALVVRRRCCKLGRWRRRDGWHANFWRRWRIRWERRSSVLSPQVLERPDCAATRGSGGGPGTGQFSTEEAPGAAAEGDTSAVVVVAAVPLAAITRMDTTIVLAAAPAAVRRMSSRVRLALRCGQDGGMRRVTASSSSVGNE